MMFLSLHQKQGLLGIDLELQDEMFRKEPGEDM